jgi:hypothetical protein
MPIGRTLPRIALGGLHHLAHPLPHGRVGRRQRHAEPIKQPGKFRIRRRADHRLGACCLQGNRQRRQWLHISP